MRKKLSAVLENVLASLSEVVPLRDTKGLKNSIERRMYAERPD